MTDLLPTFDLWRRSRTSFATYGEILDANGKHVCYTLEKPWCGNAHSISCIPGGDYPVVRYHSPKRGIDVFLFENVKDRDMIEMHIGNLPKDTDGCILLGSAFYDFPEGRGITGSAAAFSKFMDRLIGVDRIRVVIHDIEAAV